MTQTLGVGSPLWMAPEVMDGRYGRARYNPAVDVYSFGIVMFEIASDELPFYDNDWSAFEVQTEVKAGVRPALPPSATPPDGFVALMEACWAGNPRERPDFGQILAALGEIDAPNAVAGAPASDAEVSGSAAGHSEPKAEGGGRRYSLWKRSRPGTCVD